MTMIQILFLLLVNIFFVVWSIFLNYFGTFLLYSKNFFNCCACQKFFLKKNFLLSCKFACSCGKELIYQPIIFTFLGIFIFNLVLLLCKTDIFFYFIFSSFLYVTIRTDAETYLISRWVTLWAIPTYIFAAYFGLSPLSVEASLAGVLIGYFFLFSVRWVFFRYTGQEGMGLGDVELAAFIGSAIGPVGVWITILFGSISGTIFMLLNRIIKKESLLVIAFGPFLALTAIIFCLFKSQIIEIFL